MSLHSEKSVYVGLRGLPILSLAGGVGEHLIDDVKDVLHRQDVEFVERQAALLGEGYEGRYVARIVLAMAGWPSFYGLLRSGNEKSPCLFPP